MSTYRVTIPVEGLEAFGSPLHESEIVDNVLVVCYRDGNIMFLSGLPVSSNAHEVLAENIIAAYARGHWIKYEEVNLGKEYDELLDKISEGANG